MEEGIAEVFPKYKNISIMKKSLIVLAAFMMLALSANWALLFKVGDLWYSDMRGTQQMSPGEVCVVPPPDKVYFKANVTIPAKVEYEGREYNVTNIAGDAFFKSQKLETLTIEALIVNCLNIGCYYCAGLKNVYFPSSMELLGGFYNCPNLEELNLPENLKIIDDFSFQWCHIRRIVFPEGMKWINRGSFEYSSIDEIEFKGVEYFFDYSFSQMMSIPKVIKFPSTLVGIAYDAFSGNEFEEIWFEENRNGGDIGLDYASFHNSSVKRIYCNSRKVPILYGPSSFEHPELEPYDPTSGEEPGSFPFISINKGIMRLADLSQIHLYVPVGCKELYAADQYWGSFTIEEMDFAAVEAPEADGGAKHAFEVAGKEGELTLDSLTDEDLAVKVYNTSGAVAASVTIPAGSSLSISLPSGIYIAVASGTTAKAVVK